MIKQKQTRGFFEKNEYSFFFVKKNFSHFQVTEMCLAALRIMCVKHGSHNVSRWMTWLPISLKNAAKCDNWYQLQNHLLPNFWTQKAPGRNLPKAIPVHATSLSVEQKLFANAENLSRFLALCELKRNATESAHPWMWRSNILVIQDSAGAKQLHWKNKKMRLTVCFPCFEGCLVFHDDVLIQQNQSENFRFLLVININFLYRPECGRTTRRT